MSGGQVPDKRSRNRPFEVPVLDLSGFATHRDFTRKKRHNAPRISNYGFSLAKWVMNLSLLRLLGRGTKSEPGPRGPQHGTTCMTP
jgi:hypothetical protein